MLHLLLTSAMLSTSTVPDTGAHPWSTSLQALVVTTERWDATQALVERWERATPSGPWRRAGDPVPAVVGRGGLGWGRGLHPAGSEGPAKQEGDGRAPAGVFRLPHAFGYTSEAPAGSRLAYRPATPNSRCVDDPASRFYNRWVEAGGETEGAWRSHEVMRRPDELYRLGVWVDHNVDPPLPGAGSCIFLHLWAAADVPTIGCTAFAPDALGAILEWLDADARPVLVQLPRDVRERLRDDWRLP